MIMIDMMFEVIMGTTATWGCLLLLNSIHLFLEKQEDLFYYDSGLIIAEKDMSVQAWLAKEDVRPTYYKNRVAGSLP